MSATKPLIVGNWKMFGRTRDLAELASLANQAGAAAERIDLVIAPTAVYVPQAVYATRGTLVAIGGQDCSAESRDSARTGEVSAAMLADVGARYCIVGHSERRANHGETDDLVRLKAEAALGAGLIPIICVGETKAEREAGRAVAVVCAQVAGAVPQGQDQLAIAYEPVWAIGGDRPPTVEEIAEVHAAIRSVRPSVRILYGGAVNPANAGAIFAAPYVDGALVGRASLKAADFAAIILAHPAAG
jgi:triosephosphate isomerase